VALMAREAGPFSARMVAILIGAGIVAFAAFLMLSAYAGDFRSNRDGRGHALSVSGNGFAGLVELIGYAGGTATIIRSDQDAASEDLLVVAVEEDSDPGKLKALLDSRSAKPTLVVLPKWLVFPDRNHAGWVRRIGLLPGREVASRLSALPALKLIRTRLGPGRTAGGGDLLSGLSEPSPAVVQALAGKGMTPLLWEPEAGGALLGRLGNGPLYILADPDLLNNRGLKDPRTAGAALAILDALNSTGAHTIGFDVTLNGLGRSPSPLKLIFEPPFLALTIVLFVAALLAGLHGAFRFGPERRAQRAIAYGKSALVENSAALVRMARREHRAGAAYADLVRDAAARAAAAPAAGGEALDSYLDKISPAGGASFTALAARIRAAGDSAELLAAARALFLWKKDIGQ
jgi:hypothetical protein